MWKMSRPPGVQVSIASVRERKPTPRAFNAFNVSIRCGSDRPRRSSFHTTRKSPSREGEGIIRTRPVTFAAGRLVLEHPNAANVGKSIELQCPIMIGHRHLTVADTRPPRTASVRKPAREPTFRKIIVSAGWWTDRGLAVSRPLS